VNPAETFYWAMIALAVGVILVGIPEQH